MTEKDKIIKEDLKQQKTRLNHTVRLLLLGIGDAGKSTFLKQMQLIHIGNITDSIKYKDTLTDNCLSGMKIILAECLKSGQDLDKEFTKTAKIISEANVLTPELALSIKKIWNSDPVIKMVERHYTMQIPGGISGLRYYVQNSDRFAQPDFVPTELDSMMVKFRTTGISESQFLYKREKSNVDVFMIDVGGQRSERRKWISAFQDVTAVIFLVAVNEYNMKVEEDPNVNRLEESLQLWSGITGSKYFEKKNWILFLNKEDLFREEISRQPLSEYFADYEAFVKNRKQQKQNTHDKCETGLEFIKNIFLSNVGKTDFEMDRLVVHFTNALDTKKCEFVFSTIANAIMVETFTKAGFI